MLRGADARHRRVPPPQNLRVAFTLAGASTRGDDFAARPPGRGELDLCSGRAELTTSPQLLYAIHHLSISPSLPYVSSHLLALFTHATPTHKATYLALRHPKRTLAHAVRYPICDLEVVHALERLNERRGGKALKCAELPKRLVRGIGVASPSNADPPTQPPASIEGVLNLELLSYLLTTYSASPNSHNGYFLARAVLAAHLPLVRLLLSHGADPALKKGWAVSAAIAQGDLALVKVLMERELDRSDDGGDGERVEGGKKRRKSGGGGGKRRKMEVRCEPTGEMLEAAVRAQQWVIVDYLKARGAFVFCLGAGRGGAALIWASFAGATPNLNVLKLLGC